MNYSELKNHGRWSEPGIPHKGWVCIDVRDEGARDVLCEMCQSQHIRYVHEMEHPDYSEVLEVGCICASHMEQDPTAAKKREADMKNSQSRRERWLTRKWKISRKGNPYLRYLGATVTVFEINGFWSYCVNNCDATIFGKKYSTEGDAKLAVFDFFILEKRKSSEGE